MKKPSARIDLTEIGNRLRTIRQALGMSQEQFSDTIKITRGAYSMIENGHNQIQVSTLYWLNEIANEYSSILEANGIFFSIDWILFGIELARDSSKEHLLTQLNLSHARFEAKKANIILTKARQELQNLIKGNSKLKKDLVRCKEKSKVLTRELKRFRDADKP